MRIGQIDVFQVDLPYSHGTYRLSGGREYVSFDATLVRITTDSGIEGWGESTPFGANYVPAHARGVRAGIEEMADGLFGLDPRRVDRVNEVMDLLLAGHAHAKAAIDIACWDVFGKSVDLAVCELLGGRTDYGMPFISSIHVDEPDDMRAHVEEYRQRGFLGHSIKIEDDPAIDAARIEACLADKRPGEFFLVDANGGMTVETALRLLRLLPAGQDFVLEAPCATWRECVSLRRRTNVPIMWDELAAGEATLAQIIADDAADGIGLKIAKNGGLTRCRRQRDMCTAAGLTMSVQDSWGSDVSLAAIVHMGQTVLPKLLRCVLDTRPLSSVTTADADWPVDGGRITAPEAPGLGVTPRLDVLGAPVATYS